LVARSGSVTIRPIVRGADEEDDVADNDDSVDFAVAAYRDEHDWQVVLLPAEQVSKAESVPALVSVLRQQAVEASEVLGLISVGDDFFVLLRASDRATRLLLSDGTAADEWPLARSVLAELDAPVEDAAFEAVGDLAIFADLGLDAMELDAMCTDQDLYPDEVLGSVAARLGFGDAFERAIDGAIDGDRN
jgi:putative tRNA adenosine deaminase-associated protein